MQYLFSHYVILKPYLQEDDQFGFESLSCIVKITISKKNPVIEILLLFQNKFKHTWSKQMLCKLLLKFSDSKKHTPGRIQKYLKFY